MTHWIIKCAIGSVSSFCVVRTNYLYLLNLITLKRGFPVLKYKVLYCKSRFHEFVSWVVCIRGATGVERRFHGNKRVKLDTSHLFKTRLMSSDSTQHNSVNIETPTDMKVILKYFVLLISIINLSESSVIYDQVCIRNIGCDTELQDMIFGVSG